MGKDGKLYRSEMQNLQDSMDREHLPDLRGTNKTIFAKDDKTVKVNLNC